jgi:hypothetical protein
MLGPGAISILLVVPRQYKRMALFIAATDETSGGHHLSQFYRTGFLAPEEDWSRWFAPAWQERVLDGPPAIPYLHMTEMRSRKFRDGYGLSGCDAERRIDAAFQVIQSMGSLFPIGHAVTPKHINDAFNGFLITGRTASGQERFYKMDADYAAFIAFVTTVLAVVTVRFPECEKVDIVIERNGPITDRIRDFHDSMPAAMEDHGMGSLVPILGDLIPGDKDRVPLQAADLLCWYTRRAESGQLDATDLNRYATIASRQGWLDQITPDQIERLRPQKAHVVSS